MIYAVILVVVVAVGAAITFIKSAKIKAGAEIFKAGMEGARDALAPGDDTPGKITPDEWGEIVEKMGSKAKDVLKGL